MNRIAEEKKIMWLLRVSTVSRYQISKGTKVAQSTLSNLANKKLPIENITFGTAATLTAYADKIKEEMRMEDAKYTYFEAEDGMQYRSDQEVFPSDDGSLLHVYAKSYGLREEDYLLTFKPNPDYRPGQDSPEDWSDWKIITAEYVGEVDHKIVSEDSRLITLDDGTLIDKDAWNGEMWEGKYRPVYSYDYESNEAAVVGIVVER